MNVLIVCHAGAGIGLGHVTRSLVVARALHQNLGANIRLLIQGNPVQRDDLSRFSNQFLGLGENLAAAICHTAKQDDVEVVVLDLQPRLVPTNIDSLLRMLRRNGCKVISVDGLISHRNSLDLIFIPSFRFSPLQHVSGAAPIVFGWDCILLNVERSPVDWKPGRNVLVLSGGSDARGLGKTWPTLLNDTLPDGSELHWVTGPYAEQPVWPFLPRTMMINHQSPSGLDDLMMAANYAVTVYGVSFYELLYYGVPTVVFSPYDKKNDAELAVIAEAGVAMVARDEVDAVAKLCELIEDNQTAVALSQCSKQKMSACGGTKFARAVATLLA